MLSNLAKFVFMFVKFWGFTNIKIYKPSKGVVSFKRVIISISFKLQCEVKWSCTVKITHENTNACSNPGIIFCIFHWFSRHDTVKKNSTLHVYSGWGLGCVQAARELPLGELFLIPTVGWDLSKGKVGEDAPV